MLEDYKHYGKDNFKFKFECRGREFFNDEKKNGMS